LTRLRIARGALARIALACAATSLAAANSPGRIAQEPDAIARLVRELSGASPARSAELARELASLGEPAAIAALEGLPGADLPARRALAHVAREAGGPPAVDLALRVLADPDPDRAVRSSLFALLSKSELGEHALSARVDVLARAAFEDPESEGRTAALAGLARMEGEAVAAALERLALELPAPERRLAARALASHASGRERVVELVQRSFASSSPPFARRTPAEDVLAILLGGAYGVALAELPAGGEAKLDRVPFVLGTRHPAPGVRDAAARALDGFVGRLRFLGQAERAERTLGALLGEGLDDGELLVRRATLALQEGLAPGIALESARELRRRTALFTNIAERRLYAVGALLEVAARIASEPSAEARTEVKGLLEDARRALESVARERLELRSDVQALVAGEVLESLALVEIYGMLALLVAGRSADDPELLELARTAHVRLLEQQLVALPATGPVGGNLDPLFTHPLGPFELLFGAARASRARALELELALYRALATVAPRELPGFEAFQPLADPLQDTERRRELLERIQTRQIEFVTRELQRAQKAQREAEQRTGQSSDALGLLAARLLFQRQELRDAQVRGPRDGYQGLKDLRSPSSAALAFAARLREDGRFQPSREVAERMLDDLGRLEATQRPRWIEVLTARTELTLGSAWMDENEPRRAEEVLLQSLARLEAVEREMAENEADPSQLALLRGMRSSALVSLAVNANVKLGDPARALGYFERAYELRQDDFMRVLLACYRARAGRARDARDVLRDTPVSPPNYYNLACTHALLGERELALDFLRRDFLENHASDGSLERQKEWARADPDLAALRRDPAFEALLGPERPPRAELREGERKR